MQARRIDNEGTKAALKENESRIQAISSLYKKLDNNEEEIVNVQEYLKELCDYLEYSIGNNIDNLGISVNVSERIIMDADQISKIGLIVNELVTNAIKYAFGQQPNPKIDIALQANEENNLHLHIGDNGKGAEQHFQIEQSKSLGLKLVHNLVSQLGGNIKIQNKEGMKYDIYFEPSKIAI